MRLDKTGGAELDRRIAELNARDEEIENELFRLMPARAKTDAPTIFEDYTGETGREKRARWDRLVSEREELRGKLSEAYAKVAHLARQKR